MGESKTGCIAKYLKADTPNPPITTEIFELKKSVSQEEWLSYYDQLPPEFQLAG